MQNLDAGRSGIVAMDFFLAALGLKLNDLESWDLNEEPGSKDSVTFTCRAKRRSQEPLIFASIWVYNESKGSDWNEAQIYVIGHKPINKPLKARLADDGTITIAELESEASRFMDQLAALALRRMASVKPICEGIK